MALVNNIVELPKQLTFKYTAALAAAWTVWCQFDADTQQKIIASLPVPTSWLPYLAGIGYLIFRVWPQFSVAIWPTPHAPLPEEDAGEPTRPPSQLPVLTDEVAQVPVDEAIDKALRLIYGERMAEREIERIKATTALVRNQVAQPPTKGTSP